MALESFGSSIIANKTNNPFSIYWQRKNIMAIKEKKLQLIDLNVDDGIQDVHFFNYVTCPKSTTLWLRKKKSC